MQSLIIFETTAELNLLYNQGMKKYIVSKPDIMGGAPCIVGTRVPISVILYLLKQGYSLKEIDKMYPWVTLHKLEAVLNELANKMESADESQTFLQI